MARITPVNPWKWQDALGFSQAVDVRGGGRVLYCSGQTSVDANGAPMHAGRMAPQIEQALKNLETVLAEVGLNLSHVVRMNYYVTDTPAFLEAMATFGPRLARSGCTPASTLLGVASLFHPDIVVEIEATAVA